VALVLPSGVKSFGEIDPGGASMETPMLTDSGLETWLVFHKGVELADFASFPLLDDADGRALLVEYFRDHLRLAAAAGTGFVIETPTWRANPDWGSRQGYDAEALDRVNREAVAFVRALAGEFGEVDVLVSGNIGPRGDGYDPEELDTPEFAEAYHHPQIDSFVAAGADRVTMLTATHPGEAIGVVRAANAAGIDAVIAFTVETDGRLPNGQLLHEAIEEVEDATEGTAVHYGINCAHPDHFTGALDVDSPMIGRIGLLRANASRASHAELDEAEELDAGDPRELGAQYASLLHDHPNLLVLGGCCGTDARHVEAIAGACISAG
jgi:homocysteine S-methyltransferase